MFARLQALDTDGFVGAGRVYGGGLYKMEPKGLAVIPAPAGYAVGMLGKNPQIPAQYPEVITGIFDAAEKFGNLPNSFEDMQ